jgi:hypothetical protein
MLFPGAIPSPPPVIPAEVGYDDGVRFAMFGNDRLPDCTIAAIGNFLDLIWHHAGRAMVWDDAAVERMFDLVPPGDRTQGRMLGDVLRWWQANGLPDDPLERIAGFVPLARDGLSAGIYRYSSVYTRVMLPLGQDGDWDWSDDAVRRGVEGTGSHCVLAVRTGAWGVRVASYGTRYNVSPAWWEAYGQDEGYGIIHPLWKVAA